MLFALLHSRGLVDQSGRCTYHFIQILLTSNAAHRVLLLDGAQPFNTMGNCRLPFFHGTLRLTYHPIHPLSWFVVRQVARRAYTTSLTLPGFRPAGVITPSLSFLLYGHRPAPTVLLRLDVMLDPLKDILAVQDRPP